MRFWPFLALEDTMYIELYTSCLEDSRFGSLKHGVPYSFKDTEFLPFRAFASLLHIPISHNSPRTATPVEIPRILPPKVAIDVKKTVTFFNENPQPCTGQSLQASFDRLSIDIASELTLEVLKRLGNTASLEVSFF